MHKTIEVVKVTKSRVDLFITSDKWPKGRDYSITRRALIVARTLPVGKTRNLYEYQIDDLFPSRYDEYDYAEAMLKCYNITVRW